MDNTRLCNAYRREEVTEGVILHLKCERYSHYAGLHRVTLMPGITIMFELKETD